VLTACTHAAAEGSACSVAEGAPVSRHDAPAWSVDLEDAPSAAATDARGSVVTFSAWVAEFDQQGHERWRADLPGAGLDWPVLERDVVVVPTVSFDTGVAGCAAVERADGHVRWAADVGRGSGAVVAVAGGTVVCATGDGSIAAFARDTGRRRWMADLGATFGTDDVSVSGRSALAVDTETGRVAVVARVGERWMLTCWTLVAGTHDLACDLDLGVRRAPSAVAVAAPGTLVVGDGDARAVLLWDLGRHEVRAAVPTADSFDPASIPVVAGGVAVVVDRAGGVTAVDVGRGEARWRADLDQPVLDVNPSLTADTVHVVDWTGRVHHLRRSDGRRAAPIDEAGWAIAAVADPAADGFVTVRRGLDGGRLDGVIPSEESRVRPLQCSTEPGHSTRNDARP